MFPAKFFRGFLVAFILFVLLDAFWHGGVLAGFYNQRLMLLNPDLVGVPVGLSPLLLAVNAVNALALTYFVLMHMDHGRSMADAAWVGALLGFTVVGTVNGLNHVLIPGWDMTMAMVDTAWGTCSGIIGALAVAVVAGRERGGVWGRLLHLFGR